MPDDVCVYSMRPTCCCDLAEPPQKSTNKLGEFLNHSSQIHWSAIDIHSRLEAPKWVWHVDFVWPFDAVLSLTPLSVPCQMSRVSKNMQCCAVLICATLIAWYLLLSYLLMHAHQEFIWRPSRWHQNQAAHAVSHPNLSDEERSLWCTARTHVDLVIYLSLVRSSQMRMK